MLNQEIHEYFNRQSAEWNILGFLNECDTEPFQRKIDKYLKCLETIDSCERGKTKERARWRGGDLLGSLSFKAVR
ncbi:hypothetical protein BC936DRAFT_139518 [Jimgerdemannia flammicorona]|uniref:Uncharacterized protein n=1 Tax=Jimgerdemannia flammicorona TaxID=994334 RepID=A0A433B9R8_9FUNG|nr:hypothetical protein BC936DRAFT_139518 [Jimgerdemannia flammicorona]